MEKKQALFTNELVKSIRTIYTPSFFARTNLLYLQEIGTLEALEPHRSTRHGLDSYLFFIVSEGRGLLEYNGRKYHLKKDDCVFIDCRQEYWHESTDELWKLKWIHFSGNNMHAIYKKYLERGGDVTFSTTNAEKFTTLLDTIYELSNQSLYTRDMHLNAYISTLLSYLMDESWNEEKQAQRILNKQEKISIVDIKTYIDQHYKEKLSLEDIAKYFYIEKHYLVRLFKAQYGFPINAYIQQLRITEAKSLLRFSDLTVEEVGIQCGISDANYFSRTFKKVEGTSPIEFRKKWKGLKLKEEQKHGK